MNKEQKDDSVIIIGAGFAGLAAGIYAQMNGFQSQIFEMHNLPGGLCTSWKRKGYTIDGCIHWLVGSSPDSGMHDMWEEVGIAQGRQFVNLDEYTRFEDADGRTLIFYTDIDRLEKHLLAFSPQDAKPISEFISGIRMCLYFDPPSKKDLPVVRLRKGVKSISSMVFNWHKLKKWMKVTANEFAGRFKDPLLAEAFRQIWIPEFSMFFMLFTFAYLHNKNAGYPIGGSLPMSDALAKRYTELGGIIHYNKKVDKILTSKQTAYGIRLEDGSEHLSRYVISAADGHSTIFHMLRGKYGNFHTSEPYEKWPIFHPLIYVGMGINRTFDEEPKAVSGFAYKLREPIKIAESVRDWLWVHPFNHDSSLAPAGKTTMILMMPTSYDYWQELSQNKDAYEKEKELIGKTLTEALEQRFPGISSQIDMIDVATPMTFEKYTGNWKGSFEGWLITPENSSVILKKMPQTIPGLNHFFMCGQWVEPGGGLPTAIMSAKRLLKSICKLDKKKFRTETP
jgi:phytoene dehydrogenase-like protein